MPKGALEPSRVGRLSGPNLLTESSSTISKLQNPKKPVLKSTASSWQLRDIRNIRIQEPQIIIRSYLSQYHIRYYHFISKSFSTLYPSSLRIWWVWYVLMFIFEPDSKASVTNSSNFNPFQSISILINPEAGTFSEGGFIRSHLLGDRSRGP